MPATEGQDLPVIRRVSVRRGSIVVGQNVAAGQPLATSHDRVVSPCTPRRHALDAVWPSEGRFSAPVAAAALGPTRQVGRRSGPRRARGSLSARDAAARFAEAASVPRSALRLVETHVTAGPTVLKVVVDVGAAGVAGAPRRAALAALFTLCDEARLGDTPLDACVAAPSALSAVVEVLSNARPVAVGERHSRAAPAARALSHLVVAERGGGALGVGRAPNRDACRITGDGWCRRHGDRSRPAGRDR